MDGIENKEMPLVSIVITSYNRAHFIGKAITSALSQDYPNLEVIISDNCSTDNSDEIIKQYISDERIKYFVNPSNIGMIQNFIKATHELAKGKYISFVSSDDYLVNDSFISEAVKRIQQYPGVSVVTGINVIEVTRYNNFFRDESYPYYKEVFYDRPFVSGKEVFLQYPACHSISYGGTLMNREKLVGLDTKTAVPISYDVQNILQLLLTGDAAFIDVDTYMARRHEANATSTVTKAQTYIDNLAYIDIPYQYALENNFLDTTTLDHWKEDMYCNFCAQCLRLYYRQDKKQYNVFSMYLKKQYPVVYKRITNKFTWVTHYILFANKPMDKAYTHSRHYLGRLRRAFKK